MLYEGGSGQSIGIVLSTAITEKDKRSEEASESGFQDCFTVFVGVFTLGRVEIWCYGLRNEWEVKSPFPSVPP